MSWLSEWGPKKQVELQQLTCKYCQLTWLFVELRGCVANYASRCPACNAPDDDSYKQYKCKIKPLSYYIEVPENLSVWARKKIDNWYNTLKTNLANYTTPWFSADTKMNIGNVTHKTYYTSEDDAVKLGYPKPVQVSLPAAQAGEYFYISGNSAVSQEYEAGALKGLYYKCKPLAMPLSYDKETPSSETAG